MDPEQLSARIHAALTGITNPRLDRDIVAAGMVRDLVVSDAGEVTFTFVLNPDDPAALVRQARAAVQAVEGVRRVRIDVAGGETGAGSAAGAGAVEGTGRQRAAATQPPPRPAPPAPPAPPKPPELANLGRTIAISSGKGGVGKSTVSVNLAVALAGEGHRVGLMDADVYGPNIPRMLGLLEDKPAVVGRRIQPLEAYGVRTISLGNLVDRDTPAIWRGPIIMKIIQQFLGDVDWGELDYFIVDLPPGTGDAQLSLVQLVHIQGGIIVTTPQEVAVGDALRGAKMFERVGVSVVGIVENMSGFACPHCGGRTAIFSSGGGRRLAEELGVPLLAEVPLQARVQELCEAGVPVVIGEPDSAAAASFFELARAVEQQVSGRSVRLPVVIG